MHHDFFFSAGLNHHLSVATNQVGRISGTLGSTNYAREIVNEQVFSSAAEETLHVEVEEDARLCCVCACSYL